MRRRPGRQRGVAVVTAMLLTALAVTLVTGTFWQQQVLVRGIEGQRLHLQGRLIVRAALDAACLTLLDAAAQANVTTLDVAWAAPAMAQGISQGMDSGLDGYPGRDSADAGAGGRLSQRIVDAQSRFNLRNLVSASGINLFQVTAFSRLLAALQLDPALAYRAAELIVKSKSNGRRDAEPLEVQQLDDLRPVPGFTESTLERLRDFVVVLPEPTAVNVNTASAEVLTSVVNFSLQDARALIARRRQAYFKDASDFAFRLNDKETLEGVNYQVSSDYFLVHSSLTLDRASLRTQALIRRSGGPAPAASLLWLRDE